MLAVLRNGVPLTSATSTCTADPRADGLGGVLGRLHADVAGEVVERAGGDDGQRQSVLERHGGRGGDAAVAAGHTQRPGPAGAAPPAEQFVDAGVLAHLQHLGAGEQPADVRGRVVVVAARARVDRDDQPLAVGQRRAPRAPGRTRAGSVGRTGHQCRLAAATAPPTASPATTSPG